MFKICTPTDEVDMQCNSRTSVRVEAYHSSAGSQLIVHFFQIINNMSITFKRFCFSKNKLYKSVNLLL